MSMNPYNTGETQIPGTQDTLGKLIARKIIDGTWVGLVAAAATAVVWWANTERDIADNAQAVQAVEFHLDTHEEDHLEPKDLATASAAAKEQRQMIQAAIDRQGRQLDQIQQVLMENIDG